MQSQARVVVIGGGVVGASVLYHLARLGCSDALLVERSELTSGSTWHAAGTFHTLNANTDMAALQAYTIRLYREIEALTGQSCGLHLTGGLILAESHERLDQLRAQRAKQRSIGLDTEIIDPQGIREHSPITNTEDLVGALYEPLGGHLDPAGATHAFAKAARAHGATIRTQTKVERLAPRANGEWHVVTDRGSVVAEHVVNAAGLWAREVGRMAGVELPLQPMEHQYLVTDDLIGIAGGGSELPHVIDPQGQHYVRPEGRGLVVGAYERDAKPWATGTTPWSFGRELLANDLERIAGPLDHACRRHPVLGQTGIKQVINGPLTFSPDANPLMGPVPGTRNYWAACAVMPGFSQGGGIGRALAEWMIHGESSWDILPMDVARFGRTCPQPYTRAKAREAYQRRFHLPYPNEELPAGRPLHTTPVFGIWRTRGGVFGQQYGMEHVNYFAPEGEPRYETPSLRRSNAFAAVAAECHAVRTGAGISELPNLAKYDVSGPGAAEWLDRITANRLPHTGVIARAPALTASGGIAGDFLLARLAPDRFQLTAAYSAQGFHQRWLEHLLPAAGVELRNASRERLGLQIVGPNARRLLERVADSDVSPEAFPHLGVRQMHIGPCPAIVQRVATTGEIGYEIFVAPELQIALLEALETAAAGLGLRPFGMHALRSLRLEKSFGAWPYEYKPAYTPAETGLDAFVAFDKGEFVGRDAARAARDAPPQRRLATLVVDADDADAHGGEPIWRGDERIGFATSGGYAHYMQRSVALGFVPAALHTAGERVEIELIGRRRPATVVTAPLFDADGLRARE